jgi:DNA-binding NarL/FixJ family response regulator
MPDRPEQKLKVLVALGDAGRAEALAHALAAQEDMAVVLADRGDEGADVAVVEDIAHPPGLPLVVLGAAPAAVERHGPVRAVLPANADELLIGAALRLAAAGYAISRRGGLRRAQAGFDADAGDEVSRVGSLADGEPHDETAVRPTLSPREAEVLALLAEGAPNKVIARRLDISVHTAKFHVAAILTKLGAANRTDAIAIAMRQGLVLV